MHLARPAPLRPTLTRVLRALLVTVLVATGAVIINPAPAAADAPYRAVFYWVRCQDQSEPGSDEPYIKINGVRIAGGVNIDPGDFFYFFGENGHYDFNDTWLTLELWEDDGGFFGADDHLGNFYVYAQYQNDGQQHESYSFGNGEYILRYSVQSVP